MKPLEKFHESAFSGSPREKRLSNVEAAKLIRSRVDLRELRNTLIQVAPDTPLTERRVLDAIARLVAELRERLPRYDTAISDDASGRIPSLLFREIIKNSRPDGTAPQTFFVAGGRFHQGKMQNSIGPFIAEKGGNLGKVLLVTEHIATGESIGQLVNIFEDHEVDFDLAVISISYPPGEYVESIRKHLFFGESGDEVGAAFHNKPDYSGVIKSIWRNPHPVRYHSSKPATASARKAVKIVAGELKNLVDPSSPRGD